MWLVFKLFKKKVEDYDDGVEVQQDSVNTKDPKLDAVLTRQGAEIQALKETRVANNERFIRVSEELGRLRESILQREKEIKDVVLKISRTVDMVEKVQPDKLFEIVEEQKANYLKLNQKIQANRERADQIMDLLKDVKKKTDFYKGIDQVMKLNSESAKLLSRAQKFSLITAERADRVENFFIQIEKQYKKFEKFDREKDDLVDLKKKVSKDLNEFNSLIADFVSKDEFFEFESDLRDSLEFNVSELNSLKVSLAGVEEQLKLFNSNLNKVVRQGVRHDSAIIKLKDKHKKDVALLKEGFNRKFKGLELKIKNLKK